jgi:hypothetical protein
MKDKKGHILMHRGQEISKKYVCDAPLFESGLPWKQIFGKNPIISAQRSGDTKEILFKT